MFAYTTLVHHPMHSDLNISMIFEEQIYMAKTILSFIRLIIREATS